MFQNSDFILAIPRLYLTILIRKNNSSFSLFPSALLAFFSLRIDKLTIFELNQVIKSELGDINFHLRGKKNQNCEIK